MTATKLEPQLDPQNRKLEDLGPLELPTDRPRPRVPTGRIAAMPLPLAAPVRAALEALGEREGANELVVRLAAWQVLLHRLSGQDVICVGAPLGGRWLPVRADFAGAPTFAELLRRVRLGCDEAQRLPDFDRPAAAAPFFQSMVDLKGDLGPRLSAEQMDLGLGADTLYFNPDLFSPRRAEEMAAQASALFAQLAEAPDAKVKAPSLATPAARQVLPDPTAVLDEPEYDSVPRRLAEIVAATPAAIALRHKGREVSYQALWNAAADLAAALHRAGQRPGEVVAVVGRSGFGLVGAMAGALLARGVLLLIDTRLPRERRDLMLEQAGARWVVRLGGEGSAGGAALPAGLGVVDWELSASAPAASRAIEAPAGNDPAYIFFTSGTTGTPKAIVGSHRGLGHFIDWQRRTFAIGAGDRCAQLTGPSFDVVLRAVFTPLCSGAALCLPEDLDDLTGPKVLGFLAEEKITLLHAVPTLTQAWLDQATGGWLPSMRLTFFAGEALTDTLLQRWRSVCPDAEFVNLYGPTETTLAKCFYRVPREPSAGVQPVGSPQPQTQALVVNSAGTQCGLGEQGEIWIRTPFRTLGYKNAPEDARARFIANPWGSDPQDLIYKTGDRGRARLDGTLDILGRIDDQVKIMGVRIEPAEVTATLARHPGVGSCAVIAVPKKGVGNELIAYVVLTDPRLDPSDLRAWLAERLPVAAVPSAYVALEVLPLTANGKLDRRALPAPEAAARQARKAARASDDPLEQALCAIWAESLEVPEVGVDDDFFALGGHSLLVVATVSRINEALGLELEVQSIFEAPTVARLALLIGGGEQVREAAQLYLVALGASEEELRAMLESGEGQGP